MTEEVNEEQESPKRNLGGIIKIASAGAFVLVAGIAGVFVYKLLLAPMLAPPDDAEGAVSVEEIPLNPVHVVFESSFASVRREGDLPASTLVYSLTLECRNQDTADLVILFKPRFTDMLIGLHESKTRSELDDAIRLKDSIKKQALQKCNDLLRQLSGDDLKVTAVLYANFAVVDQPY